MYAKFSINSYSVIFLDWTGEILNQQSVDYGNNANVPSDPIRASYLFDGWVTNNDIQVTNFNNITDILTVEAKYTLSTHIDNTSVSRICIYPNPVSDGNLHIKTNDEIHGATIMDISGKVVYVISNTAPTQSIDVKGWKSGMYFIRIANRIHKFIVK